jgi:hypothetical protein
MTTTYKILAQVKSSGHASNTTLYTVPSGVQAVVRAINIVTTTYDGPASISITQNGNSVSDADRIYRGYPSDSNTVTIKGPFSMQSGDFMTLNTDNAPEYIITIFGVEL